MKKNEVEREKERNVKERKEKETYRKEEKKREHTEKEEETGSLRKRRIDTYSKGRRLT